MDIITCIPEKSIIVATVVGISPGTSKLLSDGGMVNLMVKVSDPSAISSIVTGTSIVVLVVPAVKVAVIGLEV